MKSILSKHKIAVFLGCLLCILSHPIHAQFTPGAGGSIPACPDFTPPQNKVTGFYIESSQRTNYSFSQGSYAVIDMKFFEPSTYEATSYTLQYSEDNGTIWKNYRHYDEDVTSTYNNFSISPDGNYTFRLLVNGGPKNGYTSNEEFAELSSIPTRFAGWGMDQGMHITGVMLPYIGRGIEASFKVRDLATGDTINGSLAYQWYRVNPLTYEMTTIAGATDSIYITTDADAGYKLCIKATGDGIKVGGFSKIIEDGDNLLANKSFASGVNTNGFTLNLYKTANDLKVEDLELRDKESKIVTINSVSMGDNAAIYNIAAPLDISKGPYRLANKSRCWIIVEEMSFEQGPAHTMRDLTINFPTKVASLFNDNIMLNVEDEQLRFKSDYPLSQIIIMDLGGKSRLCKNTAISEGVLDISQLEQGVYIVRLSTHSGDYIQKIVKLR